MNGLIRKIKHLSQRGDTIAEVLICTAVLSLLLTTAYALSNRSTIATQKSQERSLATKYLETQVELLKAYADVQTLPGNDAYFCLQTVPVDPVTAPTGIQVVSADATPPVADKEVDDLTTYPAACRLDNNANDDLYSVMIWSPDRAVAVGSSPTVRPYAITLRWLPAGGGEIEEVRSFYSLYYNTSDSFYVSGTAPEQCQNGINDDGDAHTDYPADPGCTSATDNDETNPQCIDGADNDSDTRTDYPADPGCANAQDNSESPDPAIAFSSTAAGREYIGCSAAEGLWNDGADGCFQAGNSMRAWREVLVTYYMPGLQPGPATLEITYRQFNNAVPVGYPGYSLIVRTGTDWSTSQFIGDDPTLPAGAQDQQMSHSTQVVIPPDHGERLYIVWQNNNGNDPNLQIDSVRLFRN